MIVFKGVDGAYSFDKLEEDLNINQEWLDEIGVFGDSSGFNEIAIVPRVDRHRLVLKPITNYKDCNTRCEYCLERFFLTNYPTAESYLSPLSPEALIERILEFKPSIIEMTSGELLQKKNIEALDKFFSLLDEIDQEKKLVLEVTSNGRDIETIKRYYSDSRLHIQLSLDQDEDNPRHISGDTVLTTARALSAISRDRLKIMWMMRPDYNSAYLNKIMPMAKAISDKVLLQPINNIEGFYESDKEYDIEFIRRITKDCPDFFESWYSFKSLLIPSITCFEGQTVCTTDGRVTSCLFNQNIQDGKLDYATYKKSLSRVSISAGVCHACSFLLDKGMPSNYRDLERLAYTSIGLNMKHKFGDKLPEALVHIKNLYKELIEFKRLMDAQESQEGQKIIVDMTYPSLQPYTKQGIIRMMHLLGIKVSSVSDAIGVQDDIWFRDEGGEAVTIMSIADLEDAEITSKISPYTPVAMHTNGNFPAMVWMFGRFEDILDILDGKDTEDVMPTALRRLACEIKKISYFINIQE